MSARATQNRIIQAYNESGAAAKLVSLTVRLQECIVLQFPPCEHPIFSRRRRESYAPGVEFLPNIGLDHNEKGNEFEEFLIRCIEPGRYELYFDLQTEGGESQESTHVSLLACA